LKRSPFVDSSSLNRKGRQDPCWVSQNDASSLERQDQRAEGESGAACKRLRTEQRFGKGSCFAGYRKGESDLARWFCHVCNKDCRRRDNYERHIAEDHIQCSEPGCKFSGPEQAMVFHKLKHVKTQDGVSAADSPAEIRLWIESRRSKFPCRKNAQRKRELETQNRLLGALPEDQGAGMLEKLLRDAHGLNSRSWGVHNSDGWGKSKGKGKGKAKGKGKSKGKGKRYSSWGDVSASRQFHDASRDVVHVPVLVAVPYPSMVANCVPLESPFGLCHKSSLPKQTRGICKYFERGRCIHGERCQYEHSTSASRLGRLGVALSGGQALRGDLTKTSSWWGLPSTLANRVCRPGEGPFAASVGPPTIRETRVPPVIAIPERERRDGLLRRLLRPELNRHQSSILQCVRYIVGTEFFRLEKLPLSRRKIPIKQEEPEIVNLDDDFDDIFGVA